MVFFMTENKKFEEAVKKEAEKREVEREIKHIMRQAKLFSVILGIIGLILISLGLMFAYGADVLGILFFFIFGFVYFILAIILFTQRTKKEMIWIGVICIILGLFTGFIPLLVGVALVYYYNKYKDLMTKRAEITEATQP